MLVLPFGFIDQFVEAGTNQISSAGTIDRRYVASFWTLWLWMDGWRDVRPVRWMGIDPFYRLHACSARFNAPPGLSGLNLGVCV
jgi:hypothetical protein